MWGPWLPLLFALVPAFSGSQGHPDTAEPPVVGRPAHFSGAIGSYRVTMRAEPTELQAEDPLTLTVRITGSGALEQLQRPNLHELDRFARQFQIEKLKDHYLPKERAREFDYRLRPRSPAVKEIPALPFVYFKPGILPAHKGYQTTYASAIPLTVKPRAEVSPRDVQGAVEPILPPDPVLQVVQGPTVLRHEEAFALPGPVALTILVLAPPFVCALWYALWCQRYPDAVRLIRQRRSRAARQALHALHQGGPASTDGMAQWAAELVATYLRKRLDLAGAEPTPTEVSAHLKRLGAPDAVAEQAAEFFRASDAGRFAPVPLEGAETWASAASRLILTLEAEPWLSRTS